MPRTIDTTMLQTKISEHIKELSDILTSGENVQQYMDFCTSIFAIKGMIDYYSAPDGNGNLPLLDERQKMEMISLYGKAIQTAGHLLNDDAEGPVEIQMNSIVKEMLPLLHSDHMALEMSGDTEPMPLPEIISKGRTRVVDLGQKPVKTEPENNNGIYHLKTENNGIVTEGFFMPERTVDIKQSYDAFLDEMEKKYPPVYIPLIDHFRNLTLSQAFESETISYDKYEMYPADELRDKTTEEKKTIIKGKFFDRFWSKAGITAENMAPVSDQADYLKFTDEFYNGFLKVYQDHKSYMGEKSLLNLEQGSNLDRRNTAMYRMAGFFGKPDLIPETRSMIVVRDGEPAVGTFMSEAYGVDPTSLAADSPMLKYKPEAFENPEVFDDIAAIQALDYICGNVDRRPGNVLLRFAPEDAENAKLVGISPINNGLSFGDGSFVKLSEMGAVGEDFYNAICMITKEQMGIMLSDCKLSQGEIDKAWERKEALRKKIEEDKAFFIDKEVGYTEAGRIRLVKKEEWSSYSIKSLGETHASSHFRMISDSVETARQSLQGSEAKKKKEAEYESFRVEAGAKAPEAREDIPVPVGKVIGTGILQHAPEAVDGPEENVTKLVMPSMTRISTVGDALSCRYLISYEEDGKKKDVFFTPELDGEVRTSYNLIFREAIEKNPKYENELIKLRDYYSTGDYNEVEMPEEFTKTPWEKLGVSRERIDFLKTDKDFKDILKDISEEVEKMRFRTKECQRNGMVIGEGKRIDTRNAAMSDVAETIGAENIIAKSRSVQVMSGGRVIDGTMMDRVDAVDLHNIPGNHPMAQIPIADIDKVYNTAEGLRSIADLQILDYICMNADRHEENMMYRFEDLGTDHPKFVGVIGIDNDSSFGDKVLDPGEGRFHLPALNKLQVISEEMEKKIRDPKTAEKIGVQLRTRGLSEGEVIAALTRLEQIKTAVEEKKIRVVNKDEWAKGNNTFSILSKKRANYYWDLRNAFTRTSKKGITYKEKNNWVVNPYEKKEPYFAKCQKVDSFGDAALSNKEFEKLEQKAAKEFLESVRSAAISAPEFHADSEYNAVIRARQLAVEMQELFERADPLFSFTSGTYKDVKSACSDVFKLADRLSKNMNNNDELSVKDSKKLRASLNKLSDRCAAYLKKKGNETARGEKPGKYYPARKLACENAMVKAANFQKEYYNTLITQEAHKDSLHTVTRLLKLAQAKLSGLTGEELRKKVAEVIYYKGLSRVDLEVKKEDRRLEKALQPSFVENQRNQILATPAFKIFADMNDKELRNLAAQSGGEKLMKTFVRETAKIMQRDKHEKNPMYEKLQDLYKGKNGQKSSQKKNIHEPGKN